MKSFKKLLAAVITALAVMLVSANILLIHADKDDPQGRPYRVEAGRIAAAIEDGGLTAVSTADLTYITRVEMMTDQNRDTFYDGNSDYLIREIDGEIYRFDYEQHTDHSPALRIMNVCLGITALGVVALLLRIRERIIKPFDTLRDVPFELAKGNLSIPLKESRDKYFGRFVWGLDLLREKLEQQKADELAVQKEKKTLVLSLSHDIKTPLGTIELYAKALERGLYREEQKKKEIVANISRKCGEIKRYIDEIMEASSDDFLNIQVEDGEFYLSDTIRQIRQFYPDKLDFLKIDFTVGKYADCLLKGDGDRAVEVLQNIIENAIKYGDGRGIELSFREEEDSVLIGVTNGGCTLNKSELPHIFDSFWRGSNVGSVGGSGLGLYICRQIMRKMNGEAFAEISDGGQITVTAVFCKV